MAVSTSLLPVAEPDLSPLEEQFVLEAVRSGWVSSIGAFIDKFEQGFADLCGVKHCIALANGTVALHLALHTRGIGPGHEVIVPDLTFVATAAAVRHAGATPVIVDVDPVSLCMRPDLVEEAITPRTRALIPVHLYGQPAPMEELSRIASKHNLFLLEDGAEAHGARLAERPVGSLGDAGAFSFYGNKLITTGEGGCLTTNDDAFARRARFLKDHAMSPERRYFHPEVGFNYRMTNLQAALGCAQLARVHEILEQKKKILEQYRLQLADTNIVLNPRIEGTSPVCWLVTAQLPGAWNPERQEKLCKAMREEHRVDVRPFFVPLHQLPPFSTARFVSHGPVASTAAAWRGICLPSSNRLSHDDIIRVTSSLVSTLQTL